MKKRDSIIIIIGIVFVILTSTLIPIIYLIKNVENFGTKTRYLIENDQDFASKYHFNGSGTKSDPYLLANLVINNSYHYGISIISTSKYFSIINCSIFVQHTGITIDGVSHGTCKILNNTISVSGTNGSISSICNTIKLNFANNCTIESNTFLALPGSKGAYGIFAWCSSELFIRSNTFLTQITGIVAHFSDSYIIIDNSFLQLSMGCALNEMNDVVIINNTIDCYFHGCNVKYCSNITVSYNIISSCAHSLFFYDCNTLLISYNELSQEAYGVYLSDVTYSIVHHNSFFRIIADSNKASMGWEEGDFNFWYDSTTLEGNYWSDFAWDGSAAYPIDGFANSTDPYPLQIPWNY